MEQQKQRQMTYGEKAVGLTFNPSGDPAVHECKATLAAAINQLDDIRSKQTGVSEQRLTFINRAINELVGAQMWAVKALTWRD
jgi:hypothetical protein